MIITQNMTFSHSNVKCRFECQLLTETAQRANEHYVQIRRVFLVAMQLLAHIKLK